jgi:hypothetical protein
VVPPEVPRAILRELALNVRNHFELWFYRLRDLRLPAHLAREPEPRKRWDGSFETPEKARERWVFTRLVRACLRRRVHPYDRIRAAYSEWSDAGDPPPPEALLRLPDGLVERLTRNKAADVAMRFRSQHSALRAEASFWADRSSPSGEARALRSALTNPRLDLSPFFRFVTAFHGGHHDLLGRYLDAALLEYVCHRDAYDATCGAYVPEVLRRYAEAFYAFLDDPGTGEAGPCA